MNRDDAAYSVSPKKSLGQHFLTSDVVPRWMCDAAKLDSSDTVIEVGPGTGILTAAILERGAAVHAIETDARALAFLQEKFSTAVADGQLTLHAHDMRHGLPAAVGDLATNYKVVANIPYYLSGLLLRTFLENTQQPDTVVFLIQKELAERITRNSKQSLLRLSIEAFGTPSYIRTVTAGHFHPPPKVTSAILAIEHITHERVSAAFTSHFFSVLHAGFAHKRKFAASNLARHWDRDQVDAAFSAHGIDLRMRPEDIDLENWIRVAHVLPTTPT